MRKPILTIKDFQKGIAQSPHLGFGDMRNVDISTMPGSVRISPAAVKKSASSLSDTPRWIVQSSANPTTLYYIQDNGDIDRSTSSQDPTGITFANITTTTAKGYGACIWKNYLLVAEDTTISAYGLLTGTPAWTDDFATGLTSDTYHTMFVSADDKVYIANGKKVASLAEVGTFDPANSGTFTFTAGALDLPTGVRVRALADYGKYLMVGTWKGNTYRWAKIYPWDRVSPSFNLPIELDEKMVGALLTKDNLLYIFTGDKVYASNGSSAQLVARIPESLYTNFYDAFLSTEPGAVMAYRGKILFGVSINTTTMPTGCSGVWSLDNGVLVLENEFSSQHRTNSLDKIQAICPINDTTYAIGWAFSTTYGADVVNSSITYYTGYLAYVDSQYVTTGNNEEKLTCTNIEIVLDKALATGQGVKLSYRNNLDDAFTVIGTIDFATYGAIKNYIIPATITDAQGIQIRAELTAATTSSLTTTATPSLNTINLYGNT